MPLEIYKEKRFSAESLVIIETANAIIEKYQAQGYDLTLRQLYYQFVARDLIPNRQSEYKRLGSIINDARLAGLVDCTAIVDRTRELRKLAHWEEPQDIVDACVRSFRIDKWHRRFQQRRLEVWIEKDALVGVIADVCEEFDVPYFSCRGYNSQSEMWAAATRLRNWKFGGQRPLIIHLGDHDPSGLDMTRDIKDRHDLFCSYAYVKRIALNMEQIEEYEPPPNPAKITDSRAAAYIDEHGHDSWELDALEPQVITELIRETIEGNRDPVGWAEACVEEAEHVASLKLVCKRWSDVTAFLKGEENA